MNLEGRTVWQQAAGDRNRDYSDLCLRWGVILNGPGDGGPWPYCVPYLTDSSGHPRKKKIADLARFAIDMKEGDVVVLRLGTSLVVAVGIICGPYAWHECFGDVDGWNIQHVRRVHWLWQDAKQPKDFETYAIKFGDTTQRLGEGPVREWVRSLPIEVPVDCVPLPKLPAPGTSPQISVEAISDFLFDRGVASAAITRLVSEMGELTRIARWYWRAEQPPSEHETVAYLVVPLLRALGWTPQRMALEWNHVDIALFERLPRDVSTLQIVVEAKKMGRSCLSAKTQAISYAQGRDACHRLIVTDGLRFGIYTRRTGGDFGLYAYLNLTRLCSNYPAYECHGAEEALLAMAPEWKEEGPGPRSIKVE